MLRANAQALFVAALVGTATNAFHHLSRFPPSRRDTTLNALNWHQTFSLNDDSPVVVRPVIDASSSSATDENWGESGVGVGPIAALTLLALTALSAAPVGAVSGGGLDYAGLDISGQSFSNGNYKGKDFTQVIAKGTTFSKSNLQGCRFYKAYLVNADFTGSDLRGASLEDTSMDGASLKDALAAGAYFGQSILDAGSLENADFTDAQLPIKTLPLVCEREDVKGTNPVTGADTRESLMCP